MLDTSRVAAAKYMLTQLLLEEVLRRDREARGTLRRYGDQDREAEERVRAAVDRAVEALIVELRSPAPREDLRG